MNKQPNSRMCFICGKQNIAGVHVSFYEDDDGTVLARFTGQEIHQGYPGRFHGGVLAGILDETLGRTIRIPYGDAVWGVTVELTTRYRKPVPIGVELRHAGIGQFNEFTVRFDSHRSIRQQDLPGAFKRTKAIGNNTSHGAQLNADGHRLAITSCQLHGDSPHRVVLMTIDRPAQGFVQDAGQHAAMKTARIALMDLLSGEPSQDRAVVLFVERDVNAGDVLLAADEAHAAVG